ncbi:hypothetical protein GJ496_011861 [Pomphorhynchus laevis]|nr:hypothetical protein GJ496_011861 [Pomphorhynchus laevis]
MQIDNSLSNSLIEQSIITDDERIKSFKMLSCKSTKAWNNRLRSIDTILKLGMHCPPSIRYSAIKLCDLMEQKCHREYCCQDRAKAALSIVAKMMLSESERQIYGLSTIGSMYSFKCETLALSLLGNQTISLSEKFIKSCIHVIISTRPNLKLPGHLSELLMTFLLITSTDEDIWQHSELLIVCASAVLIERYFAGTTSNYVNISDIFCSLANYDKYTAIRLATFMSERINHISTVYQMLSSQTTIDDINHTDMSKLNTSSIDSST